jgi:hypothetical protein
MKAKHKLLILALASMLAGGSLAGTKAVGGTVTTIGDQRIHTYTEVGTSNLTVTSGGFVDVLVVAGGGGGGCLGGGGGAGGLVYTNSFFVEPGTYTVVVGGGGTGSPSRNIKGGNGTNSVLGPLTAIGGGGAGSYGTRDGQDGRQRNWLPPESLTVPPAAPSLSAVTAPCSLYSSRNSRSVLAATTNTGKQSCSSNAPSNPRSRPFN